MSKHSLRVYMSDIESRLIPEGERDYPDRAEIPIQETRRIAADEFFTLLTERLNQINAMQIKMSKTMAILANKIANLPP